MQLEPEPDTTTYRELFVCWAGVTGSRPYDLDFGYERHEVHVLPEECEWGWACNCCGQRVDDEPCAAHAPLSVPGLRLVECEATERRHWLFAHDREDYGHFCPWCAADRLRVELEPLKRAAEKKAHRWCWALNPLKRAGIRLGVARRIGFSNIWACGHVDAKWRWS